MIFTAPENTENFQDTECQETDERWAKKLHDTHYYAWPIWTMIPAASATTENQAENENEKFRKSLLG